MGILQQLPVFQVRHMMTHDGSMYGAAIYAVPWIPSIYPFYVSIHLAAPLGSVMGDQPVNGC